jgi:hypothetical protein
MSDGDGADLFEGPDAGASKLRAEERRQAAAQVVHGVYRLVKACLLYRDANQTVASAVSGCVAAIGAFCNQSGTEAVMIQFAAESLFVNGQMLKTSRETYSLAMELGRYFDVCGVTDVTFEKHVDHVELSSFGRLVADGQRDARLAKELSGASLRHIRARRVEGSAGAGPVTEDDSAAARIVRTYAASVVVMRAFYGHQRAESDKLPQRVKRVAQKLVSHIEEDAHLLVATGAAGAVDRDRATTAVTTACVALGMARQLTTDRQVLAGIAMAALLYDVGRLRIARSGSADYGGLERDLSEEELARLPSSSVVALTVLGRLHAPSVSRTVIAFESQWLRHAGSRGPLYRGRRSPWVTARILAVARAFTELRWPGPGGTAIGIDETTQLMYARATDATDKVLVKLLVGALGLFPAGTMVELTTGEMGVVISTPGHPMDYARPRVQLMYDSRGVLLSSPVDLDLAKANRPGQLMMIKRSLDAEDQHMQAMRAYAQAAAAKLALPVERQAAPHPAVPERRPAAPVEPRPAEPWPPHAAVPAKLSRVSLDEPTISAIGRPAPAPAPKPMSADDPTISAVGVSVPGSTRGVVVRRGSPAAGTHASPHGRRADDRRDPTPSSPPVPLPRPSAIPPSGTPLSERDKLLSAFLADEPLDDPPEDPPRSKLRR